MIRPDTTASLPAAPLHYSVIAWIDALVADLDARLLNKPPRQPLTLVRFSYWYTLQQTVEQCKDDTSGRFQNIQAEMTVSRHWDALKWVNALVLDLKLELTPIAPLNPITPERLREWKGHRDDLLQCKRDTPTHVRFATGTMP